MLPMIRTILQMAVLFAAFASHAGAGAADITFIIRDDKGRPVKDAVVMLEGAGSARPKPGTYVIDQKDMLFVPFVLVIPAGSTVDFGNLDPFRHHIYSFSPAKKFELKLFGQGQRRSVRFEEAGIVAIGCNIHDSMQAFIQIVDTHFAGKSGTDGRISLRNVPDGPIKARIWHPQLRAPAHQIMATLNARGATTAPITIKLRPPAPHRAY